MNKQSVVICDNKSFIEIPINDKLYLDKNFMLCNKQNAIYFLEKLKQELILNGEEKINSFETYKINDFLILNLIYNEKKLDIRKKDIVTIGDENCDVYIQNLKYVLKIDFKQNKIYKISNENSDEIIYINSQNLNLNVLDFEFGDNILFKNFKINIMKDYLEIIGDFSKYNTNLNEYMYLNNAFEDFPQYKRSPRIIKREPLEKIDILLPADKPQKKKGQLAKTIIPPIVMLILTIVISIIQPRGIFIIMSIVGTLMSLIFSITSYFTDKKDIKEKNQLREKVYKQYLLNLRKQLNDLYNKNKEALEYNNLSPEQIEKLVNSYSSRIYERNNNDSDFLNINIGKKDSKPSYELRFDNKELQLDKDPLINISKKVYENFKIIENVPYSIDLKKANLGLVGERNNIISQLKLIINQLAFNQSYHDIEIILLHSKQNEKHFDFAKWYPHLKIKSINVTGLVNSERVRDQVLGSLVQILKDRKLKKEEDKKDSRFLPHYIFVIDEPKLVINHSIMEYLQIHDNDLSFSIIYTTNLKANLPENIKTIILLENSQEGRILLNEGIELNEKIKLYNDKNIDFENIARKLACLEHIKGVVSQIPNSITFFEMYGIEHPEQLNSKNRWSQNSAHKTLAVPLGVRAENDFVDLNLHEKAAGPHGLVAGTTGSGKSEIIQSYILSMAVNFHPYEVGFLLIDYKGGGMASLFKDLPHLMGTITNLDGSESMRAMASIKSELETRQHIFNKCEVNHIDQYNKMFKDGEVSEPLPHLFIISDEFAELKKEQPEFMAELVSAARIGRSLGIHLILATQKPSGVVDDQIWTNSKFKLALKVANESDSKEVIKTPDAANITVPGRAYLQVGNNEIYELFQSAWSGAKYIEEKEQEEKDDRVYLVDELGQARLINKDLSQSKQKSKGKDTQLDVVVSYLKNTFEEENLPVVRKPWLPSLERKIISPNINIETLNVLDELNGSNLEVKLGLVDIPEQQKQLEYSLNFGKDGNLAIFASGGFGKTNAILNIMFNLAINNNPKDLLFYVLDFGNANLIQTKKLPHTADYFTLDDNQKLDKLVKLLNELMKKRKNLFSQNNASNFVMYNEICSEKIPAIFVIIDNYDVVKELSMEFEDFINKLSRDGIGLGIYMIITASRSNAVKYTTLNNFKNKIALYLFDSMEYSQIVGRPSFEMPEIVGRALVKLDNVNTMQMYTPFDFNDDLDYSKKINLLSEEISKNYTGKPNEGIPMLPESLNFDNLQDYIIEKPNKSDIIIGLDNETVKPQYLSLNSSTILIIGQAQKGKTNLLKNIYYQIKDNTICYIVDSRDMELDVCIKDKTKYINSSEKMIIFLEYLENEINKRKELFEQEKQSDDSLTPKIFYNTLEPISVLIDDVDNFIELLKLSKNMSYENIIINAINSNICFIATTVPTKLKGFDNISKMFKESLFGVILGHPNEQSIFQTGYLRDLHITEQTGFIFNKSRCIQAQIPKNKFD